MEEVMKKNLEKTEVVAFRVDSELKNLIVESAWEQHMTVSEFVRMTVENYFESRPTDKSTANLTLIL